MTRTARRGKKKEPLAATPWEKLREEQSNQNQSENGDKTGEKDNLKVTRKRKLGPKVSKKAKTQLKRLTGTALKRTLSDSVKLIDSTGHSGSLLEDANVPETRTRIESANRTKRNKTRQRTLTHSATTATPASKEAPRMTKKSKGLLKNLRRKKRKRESEEERVCLSGHSGSDNSLSEQGETVPYGESGECEDGESGSGECEDGESGEHSDSGPGELREGKEEERVPKKKKTSRVRIGNRWVKAGNTQSLVEEGGGEGGEVEGSDSRMKRKRPMDEESRRKRIEHRKLRRQRKKVCFNCRQPGHWLGDCPLASSSSFSAGICFKCGSSEHSCQQCRVKVPSGEFPYAKCFICGEMGHLTRSCPDNPRGLYPRGGGCKICGSVEHLRANCPDGKMSTGTTKSTTASGQQGTANSTSADALDNETAPPARKKLNTKVKIVKF